MLQDHPTYPRRKLVATASERTATAIAAFLRSLDMPARVEQFAHTGDWHHVSVSNIHARQAHLCAQAFEHGMTEALDQHNERSL